MAKKNSAPVATARKRGRPSNASIAANSQATRLTKIAVAAASAAIAAALQPALVANANANAAQAGNVTGIGKKKTTANGKTVGRPVKSTSAMSIARDFYTANVSKMERADMVDKLHTLANITKQSANTYISQIDKANGYKLVSTRRNKTA